MHCLGLARELILCDAPSLLCSNIWNTNYVLWYPFTDEDKHMKARFSLQFEG
jgi:hypothetical protein